MGNVTIGGSPMETWADSEVSSWIEECSSGYRKRGDTLRIWVAIMRVFDDVGPPMTVRQVFYRAEAEGLVAKSDKGYRQIQYNLLHMRRQGIIPYSFISDATRWQRKPTTYDSIEDMLKDSSASYRRALWSAQDSYVEIWLEKNALAGVFSGITYEYDVGLMVSVGFSSETYLYEASEVIKEQNARGKLCYVFHFGDYDPSGVGIGTDIERKLQGFGADVLFQRVAVTPDQILDMDLPTRPTKQSDSRARHFESNVSVELDAIHPNVLRQMITETIDSVVDQKQLEAVRRAEQLERESLEKFISNGFMAALNKTISH